MTLCVSTLVAEEDRGVIGYRIFFFSKPAKSSLEMMKNRSLSILIQYHFLQQLDWMMGSWKVVLTLSLWMKSFGVTCYANKTFPAALPHLILVLAHFTGKNMFPHSTEWHLESSSTKSATLVSSVSEGIEIWKRQKGIIWLCLKILPRENCWRSRVLFKKLPRSFLLKTELCRPYHNNICIIHNVIKVKMAGGNYTIMHEHLKLPEA